MFLAMKEKWLTLDYPQYNLVWDGQLIAEKVIYFNREENDTRMLVGLGGGREWERVGEWEEWEEHFTPQRLEVYQV